MISFPSHPASNPDSSRTDRTAALSDKHRKTVSTADTATARESTTRASSPSAFPGLRFQTVRLTPVSTRRPAMARPSAPNPMNAACMDYPSLVKSRSGSDPNLKP